MKKRRILSTIMAAVMAVSGILPSTVQATAPVQTAEAQSFDDNEAFVGQNSFGGMMAAQMENVPEEEGVDPFGNGCGVHELTIEDTTATVSLSTTMDAVLVVGIYDETGTQLLATGWQDVTIEDAVVEVELQTGRMPEYFVAKAFLVDSNNAAPISQVFQTDFYTKDWVEFFHKTAADFPEERVLNFDEDNTTNFAVLNEDVTIIDEAEGQNIVVSADDESATYVIDAPSDEMKAAAPGDLIAYAYGEDGLLLINVASAKLDGDTLTLKGGEAEANTFFEHIRIDVQKDLSLGEKQEKMREERSAAVTEPITPLAGDTAPTDEHSLGEGFEISVPMTEFPDKTKDEDGTFDIIGKSVQGSGKYKVGGSIEFWVSLELQWYLKRDGTRYFQYELSHSVKVNFEFSGSGEIAFYFLGDGLDFDITPFVSLNIKPAIVLRVSGKISINAEYSSATGSSIEFEPHKFVPKVKDISKSRKDGKDEIDVNAEFSGTVFLGLDLKPTFSLVHKDVFSVSADGMIGLELATKKSIDIDELGQPEYKDPYECLCVHTCKIACFEGTISLVGKLSITAKEFKFFKQKIDVLSGRWKWKDFHLTKIDHGWDFGFTPCPKRTYRMQLCVRDEATEEPIKGAVVSFPKGGAYLPTDVDKLQAVETLETDPNGMITVWAPLGRLPYHITAEAHIHKDGWLGAAEQEGTKQVLVSGPDSVKLTEDMLSKYKFKEKELAVQGIYTEHMTFGDDTAQILAHNTSGEPMPFYIATAINEDGTDGKTFYGDQDGVATVSSPEERQLFRLECPGYHDKLVRVRIGVSGKQLVIMNLLSEEDYDVPLIDARATKVKYCDVRWTNETSSYGCGNSAGVIDADGNLYVWGDVPNFWEPENGFLNQIIDEPTQITGVKHVVDFELGGRYYGAALTENGDLYTWGRNRYGVLGYELPITYPDSEEDPFYPPTRIASHIVAFDFHGFSGMALTEDGQLFTWGNNAHGELGNGTLDDTSAAQTVLSQVEKAGFTVDAHNNVVGWAISDGCLWFWGEEALRLFPEDYRTEKIVTSFNRKDKISSAEYYDVLTPATYKPEGGLLKDVTEISFFEREDAWAGVRSDGQLLISSSRSQAEYYPPRKTEITDCAAIQGNYLVTTSGILYYCSFDPVGDFYTNKITDHVKIINDSGYGILKTDSTFWDMGTEPMEYVRGNVVDFASDSRRVISFITGDGSLYMYGKNKDYLTCVRNGGEDVTAPNKIFGADDTVADLPIVLTDGDEEEVIFTKKPSAQTKRTKNPPPSKEYELFLDLEPGTICNFYAVRSADADADEFFSVTNLLYIDQAVVGDNGRLRFTYTPLFNDPNAVKLLVPAAQNIQAANIVIDDKYATGQPISADPQVHITNRLLTEGTDYELTGDTTVTEPGWYSVTITGKGTYTGEVTVSYIVYGVEDAPEDPEKQEMILGDVNGDGTVNASDAALVLIAAASIGAGKDSGLTEMQTTAADVNQDGIVNASDAAIILQFAAALGAGGSYASMEDYLKGGKIA